MGVIYPQGHLKAFTGPPAETHRVQVSDCDIKRVPDDVMRTVLEFFEPRFGPVQEGLRCFSSPGFQAVIEIDVGTAQPAGGLKLPEELAALAEVVH